MSSRSIRWAPGLGAALATLTATALEQQPTDIPGVAVTTATSVMRDGNLFRLPNGVSPRQFGLNANARGDTIIQPSVSVDGTFLYSRQRFLLSGTLDRQLLRDNPIYDTTDLSYRASWLWQLGNEWSGELTDSQQQQRTSFADQLLTQPNHQTTLERRATVDFHPRPDRRLGVSYDQSIGRNSLGVRQINDFRVTFIRGELGLDSGLGHELVIGASTTHADYPHQQILNFAPIDNSYRQEQFDLSSLVALSEKTQVNWRIGYAKRHHPDVPQRNFGGLVWDVGLNWQPTAKVQGRIGVTRDLNAASDYDRIYTITTREEGELSYAPTVKTQLSIKAHTLRLDYKGNPQNYITQVLGPAKYREDRYDNLKASFSWTPTGHLTIQIAQILDTRNSNEPEMFQYRDWTTELDLQYRVGP